MCSRAVPSVVSAALCPVSPFFIAQGSTGANATHPRGAEWSQQQSRVGPGDTKALGYPSPQEGLLVLVYTVSVFSWAAASSEVRWR